MDRRPIAERGSMPQLEKQLESIPASQRPNLGKWRKSITTQDKPGIEVS